MRKLLAVSSWLLAESQRVKANSPLITNHCLSRVLDDDCLDDVGGLLAAVYGGFELVVDVLPADDTERVGRVAEEVAYGLVVEVVALVLKAVNLHEAGRNPRGPLKGRDHLVQLHGHALYHVAELARVVGRLAHVVHDEGARDVVYKVYDVVERARQEVYVLAVEG